MPYVGISVSDSFAGALDNATYNGDAATTSGSVLIVVGSGRVVWTGDVAVGQTVTVTGSVTVNNPPTGNDSLTTQITTDAPASNCPPGGTDALCATTVSVLRPALTITKVTSTVTTTPGSAVGYTITATRWPGAGTTRPERWPWWGPGSSSAPSPVADTVRGWVAGASQAETPLADGGRHGRG